eukprot:tig00000903_g5519.t1
MCSKIGFDCYTSFYTCGARTGDLCTSSDKRLDGISTGPSAEARAIRSYLATCGPEKAYSDLIKSNGRGAFPEDLKRALAKERIRNEKLMELLPAPSDVRTSAVRIGDLHGEWILPDPRHSTHPPERVILFLHRSLVAGSFRPFREFLSAVANRGYCRVLAFDYSLAPESVWPAQLNDVMRVYEWLVDVAHADQIVLMGDSDGAGVVAHAVAAILQRGVEANEERDVVMSGKSLRAFYREVVLAGMPADAATLPALGDLAPWRDVPVLIIAGGDEVVLDDCVLFAERATAAGVVVYLEVKEELFHGFAAFYPYLPEADDALERVAEFLHTTGKHAPRASAARPYASGSGSGFLNGGSGSGGRPWRMTANGVTAAAPPPPPVANGTNGLHRANGRLSAERAPSPPRQRGSQGQPQSWRPAPEPWEHAPVVYARPPEEPFSFFRPSEPAPAPGFASPAARVWSRPEEAPQARSARFSSGPAPPRAAGRRRPSGSSSSSSDEEKRRAVRFDYRTGDIRGEAPAPRRNDFIPPSLHRASVIAEQRHSAADRTPGGYYSRVAPGSDDAERWGPNGR